MPIVTDAGKTRAMLDELRERQVAMPCFCTENAWTTEAILEACRAAAERHGLVDLPVSISFCNTYHGRQHTQNYRFCGRHEFGLTSLLADLRALLSPEGPYAKIRVFPMLDHGQPEGDEELLEERLDIFSMVMFDASSFSFEDNIRRTADYVERHGQEVVIEGAVAELKEAWEQGEAFAMTTAEQAARFIQETGVDLIVPNVGTEHRAAEAGVARYHGQQARAIREQVGHNMVLHGTSCMGEADLSHVPLEGFVKVNVWTIIETTGAEATVDYVLEEVGNLLGRDRVEELVREDLLGARYLTPRYVDERFGGEIAPKLGSFPLCNLQRAWVSRVAAVLEHYFDMFGYDRLA